MKCNDLDLLSIYSLNLFAKYKTRACLVEHNTDLLEGIEEILTKISFSVLVWQSDW